MEPFHIEGSHEQRPRAYEASIPVNQNQRCGHGTKGRQRTDRKSRYQLLIGPRAYQLADVSRDALHQGLRTLKITSGY